MYYTMKNISLISLILITMFSCSTKTEQTICFENDNTYKLNRLDFSIEDSLKKYENVASKLIPFKISRKGFTIDTSSTRILDKDGNPPYISFCDTIEAFLYIGVANNVHFGLTTKDSKIGFYQKSRDGWIITDSTDFFNDICLKKTDINGDGYVDLRISTIYDKDNGDVLTCVFLFDKSTNTFKFNNSFGQANVEYDKEKKFVKFWIGCKKGQGGVKWRGKIVNGNLKVDSTVTFLVDSTKMVGILKLYKGSNGAGYEPIKTETGNPDSLWLKFTRKFWLSNDK